MAFEVNKTWTELKTLATAKSLGFQFFENTKNYHVFISEVNIVYRSKIVKDGGADVVDFEATYKASANGSLTQPVSIQGSVTTSNAVYVPRLAQTTTKITLTATEQSMLLINGQGQVDFMSFRFNKDEVDLSVYVDGTLAYSINLEDIEDNHKLKHDEEDETFESPIVSGKQYSEKWYTPIDFTTSFEVKAKKSNGSPKMLTGLIRYRIKQ